MSDDITLYHGSTANFDAIDLKQCRPYKDFGQGFYCFETRSQAIGIAVRNYNIELAKFKAQQDVAIPLQKWLYTYEFMRSALCKLSVKVFDVAGKEWLKFVTDNRRSAMPIHGYDIVIGPTADDRTNAAIQLYFSGGYGQVGQDRSMEILLEVLMPDNLPPQTFFATERAVEFLTQIRKERI
ncbi:MAG: DUF3990 domain-containing protein [Christensenellaceae bacterium]|jgi:hypothetical protein|nr:DUF3990 domain-containing protein [Christensenellaceae bacterium]